MRFRFAMIFLVLLPTGCKSLPGLDFLSSNTPETAPAAGSGVAANSADAEAEAVKFRVGDRFTFDNPIVRWQVVSVEGDRVKWRSDTGDEQVTGFNMLLPALEWRSQAAGSGRRFIRDQVGSLFPMKVGATLSFRSTVTTSKPPFGWEHNWVCKVTGEEDIAVLNNLFETFVVACGRERPEEIVFYYAPKIGHYVVQRIAGEDGGPGRTRNLLSFERSDGTTITDVVKSPPVPAVPGLPAAVSPEAVSPDATLSGTPAPVAPARVAPPVNAAPAGTGRPPSLSAALDSVTLRAPEFGGNTAPPALAPKPSTVTPVVSAVLPRPGETPPMVGNAGEIRAVTAPSSAPSKARVAPSRKTEPAASRVVPVPAPPPSASVPPPPVPAASPRIPSSGVPSPPTPAAKAPPSAPSASLPLPQVPVPVPSSPKPAAMTLQIPTPVAAGNPTTAAPPPAKAPTPAEMVPPAVPVPPVVTDVPAVPAIPAAPKVEQVSVNTGVVEQGVHLASYRDLANARRGWDQLVRRNGDLLEGLRADIRRVDIDSRGTYYRLYAGPVDTADAAALCEKLRTRGVFCAPQEG